MDHPSEGLHKPSRAFLVQSSVLFDYTALTHYVKDIVPIFTASVFPDNSVETLPRNCRRALEVLSGFDVEADYLVPAGDPVNIAIATSVLTALLMADGKVQYRMLKWDRLEGGYYPVTIRFVAPF